jgi:hypothetical protein
VALEDVIDAVVTLLQAIDGVGAVLGYFPVATLPEQWATMLGTGPTINAIAVSLAPVQGWTETRHTNTAVLVVYNLVFRCYQEVGEPAVTEPVFRTLLRTIADGLRGEYRQQINGIILQGPVQLVQYGHTLLADNLLCHYAELTFSGQERAFPTYT